MAIKIMGNAAPTSIPAAAKVSINSASLDKIKAIPNHPDNQGLRRLLLTALRRILEKQAFPSLPLEETTTLTEAETMLETNIIKWKHDLIQQGSIEGETRGEARGWQQGSLEAERNTLHRQLKKKFGVIPVWIEQKVEGASSEVIEGWLDEVVVASSLADIFGH